MNYEEFKEYYDKVVKSREAEPLDEGAFVTHLMPDKVYEDCNKWRAAGLVACKRPPKNYRLFTEGGGFEYYPDMVYVKSDDRFLGYLAAPLYQVRDMKDGKPVLGDDADYMWIIYESPQQKSGGGLVAGLIGLALGVAVAG